MPAPPDLVAHKPHFHRNEAWKQPVRCATTAAGTLATSFENGDSAGGVTLATGDRILVKDQAAGAENGIYRVNATGAPTRDFDMDMAAEVVGALVHVVAGTLAGTIWRCTNATAPTLGSDAIVWANVNRNPITSGSLPTVTPASATPFQTSSDRNVTLVVPVTYNPTAIATATCLVELSPDGSTYSTLATVSYPMLATLAGLVETVELDVPAGWWVKLTVTNATLGTGTYW